MGVERRTYDVFFIAENEEIRIWSNNRKQEILGTLPDIEGCKFLLFHTGKGVISEDLKRFISSIKEIKCVKEVDIRPLTRREFEGYCTRLIAENTHEDSYIYFLRMKSRAEPIIEELKDKRKNIFMFENFNAAYNNYKKSVLNKSKKKSPVNISEDKSAEEKPMPESPKPVPNNEEENDDAYNMIANSLGNVNLSEKEINKRAEEPPKEEIRPNESKQQSGKSHNVQNNNPAPGNKNPKKSDKPKSSQKQDDDETLEEIEQAIFGTETVDTEIKREYTRLQKSKIETTALYLERMIEAVKIYMNKDKDGNIDPNINEQNYIEFIFALVKSYDYEDFQQSWKSVQSFEIELQENEYMYLKEQAMHYSTVCDTLFGKDKWG